MQIKTGSNESQMIQTNLQTQEKGAVEDGCKAAKQQKKTVIFAGDLSLLWVPWRDSLERRKV